MAIVFELCFERLLVSDRRLQQLSAKHFYETGFGDDGVGLEVGVEPWIEGLLPAIVDHFNAYSTLNVPTIAANSSNQSRTQMITIEKQMASEDNCSLLDSSESLSQLNQLTLPSISSKFQSFKIKVCESLPEEFCDQENEFFFKALPTMDSKIYNSTLIDIKRLSSEEVTADQLVETDKKVILEATFEVEDEETLNYEPGDSFGFIIGNCDQEVETCLKCLDLWDQRNSYCHVVTQQLFPHLPRVSKIYDLVKYYIELRSIPKKSALRHLAEFCGDQSHKRRLLELSSREAENHYNLFVRKDMLGLLDILQVFHSCRPPLEVLLVNCPPFVPRYYSVVNAPKNETKNHLKFAFSVIAFKKSHLRIDSQLFGVFTGTMFRLLERKPEESLADQLAELSLGSGLKRFKLFKRKNLNFKLPSDPTVPVLMVGPGTGVAPFVGFLEYRQLMANRGHPMSAQWWLFYGCRDSRLDYIYQEQLNQFLVDKVLTKLCLCFSRQSGDDSEVKHVDQLIVKEGQRVFELISKHKAVVYVCGDIKGMSSDVFSAFVKVVEQYGQQSRESAVKYLRDMQTDKRYLLDIWS